MEMIAFRHGYLDDMYLAAINTMFDTLGLCIAYDDSSAATIEILYGRDPCGDADFSIIIPRHSPGSNMFPPYDPVFSCRGREIRFATDIFFIYSQMISGNLDPFIQILDTRQRKELATSPYIDLTGKALFNALKDACRFLNIPLAVKSYWPEGKDFAVCLTHDVDEVRKTYQWITYPIRCIRDRSLKRLQNQGISFFRRLTGFEPYWTFETLMNIEKIRNVRSTLFFLQETGKVRLLDITTWRHAGRRYRFRDPKITRLLYTLHEGGWDVGLHGSYYSYDNYELMKKEKNDLETVLGARVAGIRQHNLNLEIPVTWEIQEKNSLTYDTTLGFNDFLGFRWGTCFPFRYYLAGETRELSILEIPLTIEDTAYFRYERPWEEFLQIAERVKDVHGVLTLLWHHSVFNDVEFSGWQRAYENMCDYCNDYNAWITSGREIADWWLQREKTRLRLDYENHRLMITAEPGSGSCELTVILPEKMEIYHLNNIEKIGDGVGYIQIRTSSSTTHSVIEFR